MNRRNALPWLVAAAATLQAPLFAARSADPSLAALAAHEDASLGHLRAGAAVVVPLQIQEHQALARADQEARSLQHMRAGAMSLSNRELGIIGITVLVIIALIVIF